MKVNILPCLKCQEENQHLLEAELGDNLAFTAQCPYGHTSVFIFDAQRFEILFDMGTSALLDEYHREAVSTFAATQERFHEFAIKVFLAKQSISRAQFLTTWKLVASQSERQLGAYNFLYLLQFHMAPPMNHKKAEFRNNVIHKGYIPSSKEAMEYAEYVYDYIVGTVRMMRPALSPEIERVCKEDMEEIVKSIPSEASWKSSKVPTTIGLSGPEGEFGELTFRQVLRKSKEEHRLELERRLHEYDYDTEEDEA